MWGVLGAFIDNPSHLRIPLARQVTVAWSSRFNKSQTRTGGPEETRIRGGILKNWNCIHESGITEQMIATSDVLPIERRLRNDSATSIGRADGAGVPYPANYSDTDISDK